MTAARITGVMAFCWLAAALAFSATATRADDAFPREFFASHCYGCHGEDVQEGGLNLAALAPDFTDGENFARWVNVYDRLASGEMPPESEPRPEKDKVAAATGWLRKSLLAAEEAKYEGEGRRTLRRLTRAEYENTVRDLFELDGIALKADLPADGSSHGYDKHSDALDISHVNMARYLEAADRVLDMAIADRPAPPAAVKFRTTLAFSVAHVLMNGDGVLLKNKQPDPDFPPAGEEGHLDLGAHERMGLFANGASVGLFRHEDEAFHPYFNEFVSIYPGRYRIRTSLWSFQWDKGKVLPARGTEAARLSIVTLTGDGRGGGHPSTVLGYYDSPSLQEQEHEVVTWLNVRETLGFNTASLAPVANYNRKGRAMAFTGPGIACDWLEIEGPLHEVWPPVSHRRLFGELPLVEFRTEQHPGVRPPKREVRRQPFFPGRNRPDPLEGIWTVHSDDPLADADRLLADFLPRAFRRPVAAEVRRQYVAQVEERLAAGDCFETAMRWAYRAALCSPDFLYHVEQAGPLDDYALSCRLSYFLWNSHPDERLRELAEAGELRRPEVLRGEVERLLKDPKSERLVNDFLDQWLRLREIAATDPDRKLYPEFSAYLQDSMVAETRTYFRELLDEDLDAPHLVQSEFAMLNEKLAVHYGVEGVSGSQIRRVNLPPDCPRGGFLTQASILKITANGTTTSPVPRGAFVLDRLLGRPPEPPPPNIPAVEPDVRGATTIREQLAKHRADAACASCHAKIDPPGFALESYDVIGGWRDRYRSIGEGDAAPRGAIDPFIPIGFKLGQPVDSAGVLPDGPGFADIREYQALIAADSEPLLENLARQLAVYATGREIWFRDREEIAAIVARTQEDGGGLRTLINELAQSRLFQTK